MKPNGTSSSDDRKYRKMEVFFLSDLAEVIRGRTGLEAQFVRMKSPDDHDVLDEGEDVTIFRLVPDEDDMIGCRKIVSGPEDVFDIGDQMVYFFSEGRMSEDGDHFPQLIDEELSRAIKELTATWRKMLDSVGKDDDTVLQYPEGGLT